MPAASQRKRTVLNCRACAAIARSVGRRSMLLAPKNPAIPSVWWQHVLDVLGLRDGTAVAQDEDVRRDTDRGVAHRLHARGGLVECQGRLRADAALRGQADVRDQHVGARARHCDGFLGREDVGARQQVEVARESNHLDFEIEAHAGLFQVSAECAFEEPDRREVLHAVESFGPDLAQEDGHEPEGVRPTNAGEHRPIFHDREDLAGHLHHDGVGVAVRQESRQTAASGHAVPAGVVDDDEVHAAFDGALGRDAGAGAGPDDRAAVRDLRAQALQGRLTRDEWHLGRLSRRVGDLRAARFRRPVQWDRAAASPRCKGARREVHLRHRPDMFRPRRGSPIMPTP